MRAPARVKEQVRARARVPARVLVRDHVKELVPATARPGVLALGPPQENARETAPAKELQTGDATDSVSASVTPTAIAPVLLTVKVQR